MAPSAAAMAAAQAIVAAQALQAHAVQSQSKGQSSGVASGSPGNNGKIDALKRTLQASNLSPLLTVDQLKQLFGYCGTVVECTITDSKHSAYIEYSKPEEAAAGLQLNNIDVGGRPLNVEMAKSLPPKSTAPTGGQSLPLMMQQAVALQQMQFQQALMMQQAMAAQQAAARAATMKSATEAASARAAEISKKMKAEGLITEEKESSRKSRSPSASHRRSKSRSRSPSASRRKPKSRSRSPKASRRRSKSRSRSPIKYRRDRRSRSFSPPRYSRGRRSRSPIRSHRHVDHASERRSYRDGRDKYHSRRRRESERYHDRHSSVSRRKRTRSPSPRWRKSSRVDSPPKHHRGSLSPKSKKHSHRSLKSPKHSRDSRMSPSKIDGTCNHGKQVRSTTADGRSNFDSVISTDKASESKVEEKSVTDIALVGDVFNSRKKKHSNVVSNPESFPDEDRRNSDPEINSCSNVVGREFSDGDRNALKDFCGSEDEENTVLFRNGESANNERIDPKEDVNVVLSVVLDRKDSGEGTNTATNPLEHEDREKSIGDNDVGTADMEKMDQNEDREIVPLAVSDRRKLEEDKKTHASSLEEKGQKYGAMLQGEETDEKMTSSRADGQRESKEYGVEDHYASNSRKERKKGRKEMVNHSDDEQAWDESRRGHNQDRTKNKLLSEDESLEDYRDLDHCKKFRENEMNTGTIYDRYNAENEWDDVGEKEPDPFCTGKVSCGHDNPTNLKEAFPSPSDERSVADRDKNICGGSKYPSRHKNEKHESPRARDEESTGYLNSRSHKSRSSYREDESPRRFRNYKVESTRGRDESPRRSRDHQAEKKAVEDDMLREYRVEKDKTEVELLRRSRDHRADKKKTGYESSRRSRDHQTDKEKAEVESSWRSRDYRGKNEKVENESSRRSRDHRTEREKAEEELSRRSRDHRAEREKSEEELSRRSRDHRAEREKAEELSRRSRDHRAEREKAEEELPRRSRDHRAEREKAEEELSRRSRDHQAKKEKVEEELSRRSRDQRVERKKAEDESSRRSRDHRAEKKKAEDESSRRTRDHHSERKRQEDESPRRSRGYRAKKAKTGDDSPRGSRSHRVEMSQIKEESPGIIEGEKVEVDSSRMSRYDRMEKKEVVAESPSRFSDFPVEDSRKTELYYTGDKEVKQFEKQADSSFFPLSEDREQNCTEIECTKPHNFLTVEEYISKKGGIDSEDSTSKVLNVEGPVEGNEDQLMDEICPSNQTEESAKESLGHLTTHGSSLKELQVSRRASLVGVPITHGDDKLVFVSEQTDEFTEHHREGNQGSSLSECYATPIQDIDVDVNELSSITDKETRTIDTELNGLPFVTKDEISSTVTTHSHKHMLLDNVIGVCENKFTFEMCPNETANRGSGSNADLTVVENDTLLSCQKLNNKVSSAEPSRDPSDICQASTLISENVTGHIPFANGLEDRSSRDVELELAEHSSVNDINMDRRLN